MALKKLVIPDSDALVSGGATPELMGVLGSLEKFTSSTKTLLEGTITDTREFSMSLVENGTYHLALNTPFEMEITNTSSRSDTGTCTATFKIDGVSLGGTANSVSTTETTQAHTTDNVAAVGSDVTVVLSSNSSCEGLRLSMVFKRPLIV